MSHQITIEADHNNIILTQTDDDGDIFQEYFIHEDDLIKVINLLRLAQRKENHG